jgi:hypothetical protein
MANRFRGKVVSKLTSKGSKSERMAVQLDTGEELYILRRRGGNPFRDEVLEELVGKTIDARGRLRGQTLFLEEWREVE